MTTKRRYDRNGGHASVFALATGDSHPIAASTTAALGASGGAAGDRLHGLHVVPATTSPGAITIKDSSGGTERTVFTGGASSVSDLKPFFIYLGDSVSQSGAWYVTTGANVSVLAFGDFT